MFRIWAKIIINEKLVKDTMLEISSYDFHKFNSYMQEIAYRLDIPTPVIINRHIINFTVYNNTTFLSDDFVESINFDKLVITNATL